MQRIFVFTGKALGLTGLFIVLRYMLGLSVWKLAGVEQPLNLPYYKGIISLAFLLATIGVFSIFPPRRLRKLLLARPEKLGLPGPAPGFRQLLRNPRWPVSRNQWRMIADWLLLLAFPMALLAFWHESTVIAFRIFPIDGHLRTLYEYSEELLYPQGNALDTFGAYWTIAIVAPVCTELFFRGLLLSLGMETANLSRKPTAVMWYAIIFQTILYAFSNLNPWEIVTGIPLGLIFGYLRVRMASILVPAMLHVLFSSIKISNTYFWPEAPFLLNRPDGI
ncbi:MAG: CPBP family intramembrane metalloprotease [Leptospiraceae bacterium]|nr:CPBP family intramembrane metalloprotease [Leptospiraceae bacterium]